MTGKDAGDPSGLIGYNFLVHLVFGGLLLFLLATGVSGQVTGVVVDGTGSTIAGAIVELTNPNLSDVRTTTDTEGRFSLAGTITDRTRLTVRATGFSPFERSVASDADYKIVLQPAALTADVTVSITRTETRLNETPASVVVIGRNDLALGAARSIDDSLRQIAGFTLFRRSSSRTANPTTHGANLRGSRAAEHRVPPCCTTASR